MTGPPAAGKTTLSQHLAQTLRLPLLARDSLKEILFDTLGWGDAQRSKVLGAASFDMLYHCLELLLQTGQPCMVESNFSPERASAILGALVKRYGYTALQLVCTAPPELLAARYAVRHAAGSRHPGHAEPDLDFAALAASTTALAVPGPIIMVDTSIPAGADYAALEQQVRAALG